MDMIYNVEERKEQKKAIIAHTIQKEGGYANNPSDSGGKTMYGITEAVARYFGHQGDMRALTLEKAVEIYSIRYWAKIKGDQLLDKSEALASKLFDAAVNLGVSKASHLLQRCLSVLSESEITLDGIVGSHTIQCLESYMKARGEDTLLKAINCLQGSYYIEIAEKYRKNKTFIHGWLNNRVTL